MLQIVDVIVDTVTLICPKPSWKSPKMKKIQVLGPGCASCGKLAEMAQQAANELAIEFEFEKVTDMNEILAFNVPTTPALVVDGEVKICGRVPTLNELKSMISQSI